LIQDDMTIAQPVLPENPDELRTFTLALQANFAAIQTRNQVLEDELYAKTLHIEKLKMQLAALRRARFGRSSEKLDREIEQLELAIGELEEGQAQSAAGQEAAATQPQAPALTAPRPSKGSPVRRPLPAHLPRERVDHPAACSCPAACWRPA